MPQQPRALVKYIRDIREAPDYILGDATRYNAVLFRSPETIALARAFSYTTDYPNIEGARTLSCFYWSHFKTPDAICHLNEDGRRGRVASLKTHGLLQPFLHGLGNIVRPAFPAHNMSINYSHRAYKNGGEDHCDEFFSWVANLALGTGRPSTEWRNGENYFSGDEGSLLICNGKFSHRTPPYDGERAIVSALGLKL